MLQIGICDDNISELNNLKNMIEQYFTHDDMKAEIKLYSNGQALLTGADQLDILFLDIELGENSNGLDIAQKYQNEYLNTIIIFVSCHQSYISDSYHFGNVYQYLLKPIDQQLFVREMQRVVKRYYYQNDFYYLKDRAGNSIPVKFKDIVFLKSDRNQIHIQCNSTQKETYRSSFYREAQKLSQYGFLRCHRQYIINMRYVDACTEDTVILSVGRQKYAIPLGKNKFPEVNEKILDFKARYVCSNFM